VNTITTDIKWRRNNTLVIRSLDIKWRRNNTLVIGNLLDWS
jgi:hypothetical protein